jgi:phosphate transport system substrate-binding protein
MGVKWLNVATLALTFGCISVFADARETIGVVGSSTVFPFSKVVAERFGRSTRFKTPTIEQIGTGGGFKEFCRGVGTDSVDIVNASRRIKKSEFRTCVQNGVDEIVEVQIGYDGIVLANKRSSDTFSFSRADLYLALAKYVPDPNDELEIIENPYQNWNEINSALPARPIEVIGPSRSSGTRDIFIELVMQQGCLGFDAVAALATVQPAKYRQVCQLIREDGVYIDAGENDHFILQKLNKQPGAIGIFGFSFLDQNDDIVHAANIDGIEPSFESIASGRYPITRALYFYVKKAHVGVVPGIDAFLREFSSEKAWGDHGYLSEKGMIPSSPAERKLIRQRIENLQVLNTDDL